MKAPLQTSSLLPAAMALITIGTVFSTTCPASADTVRWDGSENLYWDENSNWTPLGAPDGDDIALFSGDTPNTHVELNEDVTVWELLFEGNTNYILSNATSMGKQISLGNGIITTTGSGSHRIDNDLLLQSHADWAIEADLEIRGNINAGNNMLDKYGSGTLTLTGGTEANPSSVGLLHARDGHLIFDGARMNITDTVSSQRAFAAYGGDITLQNGANVQLSHSGQVDRNSTLTVTGSGTTLSGYILDAGFTGEPASSYIKVHDGAAIDFTGVKIGLYSDGAMTVHNGGTVRTDYFMIGVDEAVTGKVFVRGNGSLIESNSLELGGGEFLDLSDGKGFLTVENGGLVRNTDITTLWTPSSSITINNGGMFETDQLIGEGTIYLSGDDAMTVGINNGNSTFDGQIQDAGGSVPGRLTKTGTGNFTLTGGTAENPMSFDILDSEGGEVILDGTHINLTGAGWYDQSPLIAEGGDITIQNGAVVRTDAEEGNMWVNGNTLTTTGSNTSLTGSRIDVTGGTGKLIVTDNAEVDLATTLYLGGYYGDGQMEVRGGGTLSSDVAYFRDSSTAQITGYNSRLLTQQIYVTGNSTLTVDDNGAVEVADFIDLSSSANSSLTIDDGGSVRVNQIKGNGTISFVGDDALTVGINNGSSTFSGLIQDAGGDEPSRLTKVGSGTFTLAGGTAANPMNFGILDSEDGEVVLDGAHINLSSTEYINRAALLVSGGDITLQNGAAVQLDEQNGHAFVDENTLTITGSNTLLTGSRLDVFGDTGNVIVQDNAKLDLANFLFLGDTFGGSGQMTVQSGAEVEVFAMYIEDSSTLNAIDGGSVKTNTLTGTGTINLSGNSELIVGINNGGSIYKGVIQDDASGLSTLTKTGTGTFTLSGNYIDASSSIGRLVSTDGTVILDEVHVNLTGTGTGTDDQYSLSADGGDITLQNGAVVELDDTSGNVWVNSTLSVIDSGSQLSVSTLTVDATGTLIIDDGSTVEVADETILSRTIKQTSDESSISIDGGVFRTNKLNTSTTYMSPIISISGDDALTVGINNGSSTFDGAIRDVAGKSGTLTKEGSGTFFLTNENTYTGGTIINGGTLQLGSDTSSSGWSGSIKGDVINNATLAFNRSNDLTYAGVISGTGQVIQQGTGSLTLTGANTYGGGTKVTDGTLIVSNTIGSATGSGEVAVFDGGTLGGNGMIASKVFINDGGTLAPGESAGHLTVNDVVFGMGSTFEVELGGLEASTEYDVLSVLGYAILDNGPLLEVSLIDGFELDFGQHFEIVNVGDRLIGGFNSLVEGARVSSFNDIDLFITYQAGDGNDIALYTTAIPEPASFVLLGLGGLTFILREKRCTPERRSA
ncbi:autotransporter-associated beta strand repeat-containing protein [Planctomycetota bacterium]|nr:autotransporter-associated beta strand repeat-containing protein [Planctomycetota bacterium]